MSADDLLSRARSVAAIPWVDGEVYDVIVALVATVESAEAEVRALRITEDKLRAAVQQGVRTAERRGQERDEAQAEMRALNERLTAAHNVIRHLLIGDWFDGEYWVTNVSTSWGTDEILGDVSPAEAAALRAATADPTPQTETET